MKWVAGAVAVWLALFGPGLLQHMGWGADPWRFNDDVRQQIWPLFRYVDAGLFPGDYIADYYLTTFLPSGHRALYAALAPIADPATVSKVLPYLLHAATVALTALVGGRLAGRTGFLASGLLCLNSLVVLDRCVGGLPRAFGFPVTALALYGLVSSRAGLIAAAVLAGAAFYPSAALGPAIALLGSCFFFSRGEMRGGARGPTWRRRFALVAVTGMAAVLLVAPQAIRSRRYGAMIRSSDIVNYPELGEGGRYFPGDRWPFKGFLAEVSDAATGSLRGSGRPILPPLSSQDGRARWDGALRAVLLAVGLGGFVVLCRRSDAARRGSVLLACGVIAYFASGPVSPLLFLPPRQLFYVVPLLVFTFLPASGGALLSVVARSRTWLASPVGALLPTLTVLVCFGGLINPAIGSVQVPEEHRPLYRFLSTLPPESRIAGFPTGPVDDVPYLCRRSVLVNFETHQILHAGYVEEMRRRTRALLSAYYAADLGPLESLRREFGVSHLVVNIKDFEKPPTYFQPFDVREVFERGRLQGFIVPGLLRELAVYSRGDLAVLDLRKPLPPATAGAVAASGGKGV